MDAEEIKKKTQRMINEIETRFAGGELTPMETIEKLYNEIHSSGYQIGYSDGYESGYLAGYAAIVYERKQ